MKPTRYKDPNRLADVMALIQVLAQGPNPIRTEDGLKKQLTEKPTSNADSWIDIATNHREFFRVRPADDENPENVALIWRHALSKEKTDESNSLEPESTAKLLEIAVSMHDRELTRSQRFAYLVPLAGAVLSGLVAILLLVIKISFGASGSS